MINNFSVTRRNVCHWDIYCNHTRLCKIRGEEGNYSVYRDYGDIPDATGFNTVSDCMKYICDFLMKESKK